MSLTGAHPHVTVDSSGRILVVFSDVAQWKGTAIPERSEGQVRLALRSASGWELMTLFRQPAQNASPEPLHFFSDSAVVTDNASAAVYVLGTELVWFTPTTTPESYASATLRARFLQLGGFGGAPCESELDCDDGDSCSLDLCETTGVCSHTQLEQCHGLHAAPTCGCTGSGDCCSNVCESSPVTFAPFSCEVNEIDCCAAQRVALEDLGLPQAGPFPHGYWLNDSKAGCSFQVLCNDPE
jgi:hypothetical protein